MKTLFNITAVLTSSIPVIFMTCFWIAVAQTVQFISLTETTIRAFLSIYLYRLDISVHAVYIRPHCAVDIREGKNT